jgi:signal transduction histidine kinase
VTSIANRLLTFARESPRDRVPVDLNIVVTETLSLLAQDMTHAELSVSCSLAPGLPPVLGHANALGQVVLNLLTNAGQAIGGTGTIRVKTEFVAGKVFLEVADDGPGIPPEVLPRIFEPFYTTRHSGSGLGLSVSYGIVQDHNGTIDVHSEPGHGATFRLSFPPAPEPRRTPDPTSD